MKLADRLRRLVGSNGGSSDMTDVIADAYDLAAELTIKAREARRRMERLQEDDKGNPDG